MKAYLVMIDDRHTDPTAEVFLDPDKAVAYARGYAQDGLVDEDPIKGWLYHATYSVEGDSVWVIKKEIHE